jgi:predicted GNAT family acetyltransferase
MPLRPAAMQQGGQMSEKPVTQISYEDQGHKGRFVARIDGVEGDGELTISKVSDVLVIADHTLVPDTMRGTGAGAALVQALIADARAKSYRIMPLCPFVKAQSLRHPEWSDVIQQ